MVWCTTNAARSNASRTNVGEVFENCIISLFEKSKISQGSNDVGGGSRKRYERLHTVRQDGGLNTDGIGANSLSRGLMVESRFVEEGAWPVGH